MLLEIITPDKKLFEGQVSEVKFPGTLWSFEVLINHAPLISTLEAGNIRIRNSEEEVYVEIKGGLVEVLNNKIIVLAS